MPLPRPQVPLLSRLSSLATPTPRLLREIAAGGEKPNRARVAGGDGVDWDPASEREGDPLRLLAVLRRIPSRHPPRLCTSRFTASSPLLCACSGGRPMDQWNFKGRSCTSPTLTAAAPLRK